MEVDHPGAHPLSSGAQAVLACFRERLHARVAQGGPTADDVRRIVEAMHGHPEIRLEAVRILRQEAAALLQGQRLMTFDWD